MSLKSVRGRTTVVGPAKEYSSPLPLNAANYAGAWAFSDGRMAYSDGTNWQELISNISVLVTKTVGSGGDFPTLGAALAYFAGFAPTAGFYDYLGRIVILDGHVVAEQVQMFSQNLGWVAIESETPFVDVDVDLSVFTEDDVFSGASTTRSFLSFVNGTAPILRCRFKATGTAPINPLTLLPYDTRGVSLRTCFMATLDDDPLPTNPPATGYVFRTALTGFDENLRVGANSTARITCMEFKDATSINVQVLSAELTLLRSRVRGGGTINIAAGAGSRVGIGTSDFQTTIGVNVDADLTITQGSIVSIFGATPLGGVSEDEIVPTGNGIVFDDRAAVTPIWSGFIKPQAFTVGTLPSAAAYPNNMIYVSDATDGGTMAFSVQDGPGSPATWVWRRVQDRNVIT